VNAVSSGLVSEINLDAAGDDPDALEALQRLLRLGAASGGESQSKEVTRVTNDLLREVQRDPNDPRTLAWFVYVAGRATAVLAASLADFATEAQALKIEEPESDFREIDASDAMRVVEAALEREMRGESSSENDNWSVRQRNPRIG
jgi:hypothetical protein